MRATIGRTSSIANGRYRLVGELGAGGMAIVYAAFDTMLKVKRAIKVLNSQYAKNEKVRQRFLAEAQTMAMLRHPNIVTIYDIGMDGDTPFIVMEMLHAGSLQGYIERAGKYSGAVAARLMQGSLQALQVAHDAGVIHRDIKPHNILLTIDGEPKLTDFGIAQVTNSDHSLTKTGAVMGTLAYMAPEQRMNAKASGVGVDIYSAGASLYSMIKGEQPFDLYSSEFHERLFEGVEDQVRAVIAKACQFEASERYLTATEMAEALIPISQMVGEIEWENFLEIIRVPTSEEGTLAWEPSEDANDLQTFEFDADNTADGQGFGGAGAESETDDPWGGQVVPKGGRSKGRLVLLAACLMAALGLYFLTAGDDVQPTDANRTARVAPISPVPPAHRPEIAPEAQAADVEAELSRDEAAATSREPPRIGETVLIRVPPVEAVYIGRPPLEVEPEPEVEPAPEAVPTVVLDPVMFRINTIPPSTISIDGAAMGSTYWSGELTPGSHSLRMTANDGRVQQTTITVSANSNFVFCWQFDSEGPCPR